ncbi:MAG: hypothetical protein ACRBN8_18990 [Nannocystales bacterium]
MAGRFTELRSELMQLEANASEIRLNYELDPASLSRHTHSFAQNTKLPLPVSRSLVRQAVGLEALDREPVVGLYDTQSD